jgi:hypothetical protein
MRKRSSIQALRSVVLVVTCAAYAYVAQINGISDFGRAVGVMLISAIVLGYFWRRQSNGEKD